MKNGQENVLQFGYRLIELKSELKKLFRQPFTLVEEIENYKNGSLSIIVKHKVK